MQMSRDTCSHEVSRFVMEVHTNHSYRFGTLDNAKQTVLEDLGMSIPQITFQDFLEFLAPPQPNFNLDATMESLKKSKFILPSGLWSSFDNDPINRWPRA